MVVDAQSVAHEVHVTTGIRSAGRTQILSGLKGGETVVTEGNYGLPDGTKVAVPHAALQMEDRQSCLSCPQRRRDRGQAGLPVLQRS
jgi:hypothetical protein